MMRRNILYIVIFAFTFSSCAYQKLLKSTDNELKYAKAKEYYEKKDYMRASTLLEDVAVYYKGTQEADKILYMIADSYYNNKSYLSAANYYKSYNNNFPKGEHAMESRFMLGYCYYRMSPDPKLDQSDTHASINAFNTFLELYPNSARSSEASKLALELYEKLVKKELLNAQLYYKLGNYQGNNYQSVIIVAQNVLNDYPYTQYREDLRYWILKSKYTQAVKSVESKKEDRFRDTIDEYYVYAGEFPNGKYIKEAEKFFADANKYIKN